MGDAKSLAHTKWNCKYHIVFAPKYRRQVFYGEKKRAIGEILRKLCEWKGVKIIEAEIGFSTHSYFSNSFHDFFGMTPKEFTAKYMNCTDEETLKNLFG